MYGTSGHEVYECVEIGTRLFSIIATGNLQVRSTVVVTHTGRMSIKLTEVGERIRISHVVACGKRYCSVARHSSTDRAVASV